MRNMRSQTIHQLTKYKPTSPGIRHRKIPKFNELTPDYTVYKNLTKGITKSGGRNNQGKITIRHRGGGHKRLYRIIDFNRNVSRYSHSVVDSIQYDPNRSCHIALCVNPQSKKFYILSPLSLKKGDTLRGKHLGNNETDPQIGEALQIKNIKIGSQIFNIQLNKHSSISRAAGSFSTLISHLDNGLSLIKLPSKKNIYVNSENLATVGTPSNIYHKNRVLGKAGASR